MHRISTPFLAALAICLVFTGCADSTVSEPVAVKSSEFTLTTEPANALEILDAREQAKDGEPIVVVGRLGGGIKPWIDGRAAFLVVDTRVQGCGEGDKCDENCPGCSKEMAEASTMVKFHGADGKVLATDARQLLGVKELETVVIRGTANRDKAGNVTIAANGIFIRR